MAIPGDQVLAVPMLFCRWWLGIRRLVQAALPYRNNRTEMRF